MIDIDIARSTSLACRARSSPAVAVLRRAHAFASAIAARDSARAAQLARMRFDAGATGLLDVLDAERTQLQAEDAFAAGRARTATQAVALYRALAGGWPQTLPLRETAGVR